MARRNRKSPINRTEIEPVVDEKLTIITPDTNVTEMPYQGFISNQEYYCRMQSSCFELDSALKEIIDKKFTGNNLRNMTDENAIEAYKAMEKAKLDRSKAFIDLVNHMSNDEFFRKQQELERLKLYGNNNIVDGEVVSSNDNAVDGEYTTISNDNEDYTPEKREQQQRVIRLLQEAVMKKLEEDKTND